MQFAHHTDHAARLIAAGVGKLRNDLLELGEDRGSLAERRGDISSSRLCFNAGQASFILSVQAIFPQALGRTRSSGF